MRWRTSSPQAASITLSQVVGARHGVGLHRKRGVRQSQAADDRSLVGGGTPGSDELVAALGRGRVVAGHRAERRQSPLDLVARRRVQGIVVGGEE